MWQVNRRYSNSNLSMSHCGADLEDKWVKVSSSIRQIVQLFNVIMRSPQIQKRDFMELAQELQKLLERIRDYRKMVVCRGNPLQKWKLWKAVTDVTSRLKMLDRVQQLEAGAGIKETLWGGLHNLEIVREGLTDQCCLLPNMPDYVIGQVSDMENLKVLLIGALSREVKECSKGIVCVVGLGGSGKTTLVNRIINDPDVYESFGGISMVRTQKHPLDSMVLKWQRQIWLNLIGSRGAQEFTDKEDTARQLKAVLENQKVLLVLDNVWSSDDIKSLLVTNQDNGSMILVTTRVGTVPNSLGGFKLDICELSDESSMKLFCHHAFQSEQPPSYVQKDVEAVVRGCYKLPLALEVTACSMASNVVGPDTEAMWQTLLADKAMKLQNSDGVTLEKKVLQSLRLSFDTLSDKERDCFLHFASVAGGYHLPVSDMVEIWAAARNSHEYEAAKIWMKLFALALVKLDETGGVGFRLTEDEVALSSAGFRDFLSQSSYIHDALREMALSIIREEDSSSRDKWYDAGPTPFKRLAVDWPAVIPGTQLSLSNKKIDSWNWNVEMPYMRVILLRDTALPAIPSVLWLARHLCVLDLSFCNIATVPDQIRDMRRLKVLRLDVCKHLKSLPNSIGDLSELTVLSLRLCKNLQYLPKTVGELGKLSSLYAPGCAFAFLPSRIGNLANLQRMDLSSCGELQALPTSISALTSLEQLNLLGLTELKELPQGLGELKKLRKLFLGGCQNLSSLPSSVSSLCSLEFLDLQCCRKISVLPADIGGLSRLRVLLMNWCRGLKKYPSSLSGLHQLERLGLDLAPFAKPSSQHIVGHNSVDGYLRQGTLPDKLLERIRAGKLIIEDQVYTKTLIMLRKVLMF